MRILHVLVCISRIDVDFGNSAKILGGEDFQILKWVVKHSFLQNLGFLLSLFLENLEFSSLIFHVLEKNGQKSSKFSCQLCSVMSKITEGH